MTSRRARASDEGEVRDEALANRATAVSDTIVELIGVFTHDLSNPLQSLTVLLELTLDDLPPNSEEHAKLQQSLEATERMRSMIRDFAGLARSGRGDAGLGVEGAISRVLELLRRRFDRHKIRCKLNVEPIADALLPDPQVELALLSVLLGVVAAAASSEFASFEFGISGLVPPKLGGETARIEVGLSGHRFADQTLATMTLGETQVRRAQDMVAGTGAQVIRHPNQAVRIEFPLRRGPAR